MEAHRHDDLQAEFREIRDQFFPRWRTGNRWILKEGSRAQYRSAATGMIVNTTETGYCDPDAKIIWLDPSVKSPQDRKILLIHECTHAVAEIGHGKRFVARLRQAAERAKSLGDESLSVALLEEARVYSAPH